MLDYTKKKKKKFEVKLYDGSIVKIPMPTKKVFDMLVSMEGNSDTDTLYEAVTMIINSNGTKIYEDDEIEGMLDYEDVGEFIHSYVEFVKGATNDPN